MKKARWIWVLAIAVALTAPALAGGKDHPCTASTQDCLDKMVAKLQHKGWVGIEYDMKDGSPTPVVMKVIPDSPAANAGLHKGDVLLAVDGVKYGDDDKSKWQKVKQAWTPGSTVTYTVARNGKKKEVAVTLGKVPEDVLAAWIGEHMLQHATVEVALN